MKYLLITLLVIITGCKETKVITETVTETIVETVTEYIEVEKKAAPKISLSFDDGEAVKFFYENRFLFLDRGITATMFVSRFYKLSDYEKQMLVELDRLGFEVGVHSEYHHNMNQYIIDYGRDQYVTNEIERPIAELEELGITVKSMAYPFGAYDGTINNLVNHKYNLRSRAFDISNGILFNQTGKTIVGQSIDQGGATIEQVKSAIEKVATDGGTIYLTGHVINDEYLTRFYTPASYLIELIDHAQSLNVEFCNFSEC